MTQFELLLDDIYDEYRRLYYTVSKFKHFCVIIFFVSHLQVMVAVVIILEMMTVF